MIRLPEQNAPLGVNKCCFDLFFLCHYKKVKWPIAADTFGKLSDRDGFERPTTYDKDIDITKSAILKIRTEAIPPSMR